MTSTLPRASLLKAAKQTAYKYRWVIAALLLLMFVSHMLHDVECAQQDVSVRGPRIFSFLKNYLPKYQNQKYQFAYPQGAVFVDGPDGIGPQYVKQGGIYDCRFLASVSSLANTPRGRKLIADSIHKEADGNYKITLPGINREFLIAPLTPLESMCYARAISYNHADSGLWLPLLEKAYGTYRNENQGPYFTFMRTIKHGIFEGRFTDQTELPGFAATFGGSDDIGAKVFVGKDLRDYPTFNHECGDFGIGAGYVTVRQMESWIDRQKAKAKYLSEMDSVLDKAIKRQALVIASTSGNLKSSAYGVRPRHAFAVLGYDHDRRIVKIGDPYGSGDLILPKTGKPADGVNDGIFWLSLSDFNELYSHIYVEPD